MKYILLSCLFIMSGCGVIERIAQTGGTTIVKDEIYIGISPEGRKMHEVIVTTSHTGLITPATKGGSRYICETYHMIGLNSPKTGYPVCVEKGEVYVASQSGMGNAVVTTTIGAAGLYFAARGLRPDNHSYRESTELYNEGSSQTQGSYSKGGNSESYSGNYNQNINNNANGMMPMGHMD